MLPSELRRGSADLLEGGLGMAVDIAPEGFQGLMARGDFGLDFHVSSLPW